MFDLVPRLFKIIAGGSGLAVLGGATSVVVQNSAGVDIDTGFTYEIVNDSCSST